MSRAVPVSKIIQTMLSAGRSAFSEYREMSGGDFGLDNAPESFLQARVAMKLGKLYPCYVTLEDTLDRVKDWAPGIDGRKVRGSKSGRFDILVWGAGSKPRIAVEVKKARHDDACTQDAERIRKWIGAKGLQSGILLVYASAVSEGSVMDRLKAISSATNSKSPGPKHRIGPKKEHVKDWDEKPWYWALACYEIK